MMALMKAFMCSVRVKSWGHGDGQDIVLALRGPISIGNAMTDRFGVEKTFKLHFDVRQDQNKWAEHR